MSASDNPIFEDDIGTIFKLTVEESINGADVVVDVSSQTALTFFFKKPDNTVISRTPVFTTDGTDGKIQYVILIGELDQLGTWQLQAEVTITSGTFRTEVVAFDVLEKVA